MLLDSNLSFESHISTDPQPSAQDHKNQMSPLQISLVLQPEIKSHYFGFVWPEENWPLTESGFSQGLFSILSPMEFWFLATVAFCLLSWGHFISGNTVDLIAQILFEEN